ncbi:Caffeic acid 3-O-methyltransferase [Linum perenne]
MVDKMLRLLATHSIVDCTLEGGCHGRIYYYSLNPISKYFVKNENYGVSLAPLLALTQDQIISNCWSQVKDAMVEGGVPFDRAYGCHIFEYPGQDPRFNHVFNAGMLNQSTLVIKEALNSYEGFEKLKVVVDVGGGLGHTISAITCKYPHIKGINFDLPHVIKQAPPIPGNPNLASFLAFNFNPFLHLFLKWILHDWSDDHCLTLLKNCYKATPKDGKVIVMDAVAPIMTETTMSSKLTAAFNVAMMILSPGGKERSKDEFMSLAIGAGFRTIRFECFVCNFWVMEFLK